MPLLPSSKSFNLQVIMSMLNLQLSLSIAATLLLLPNLALAHQIDPSAQLEFGQIQSQIASNSAFVAPMPDSKPEPRIARSADDRHRQRRNRVRRRTIKTISAPVRKNSSAGAATIRQSSDGVPITKQQQSVQCSVEGSSTVTQSSTTTVNGRTTSAQTQTNCN
jgi:hypothetical protein